MQISRKWAIVTRWAALAAVIALAGCANLRQQNQHPGAADATPPAMTQQQAPQSPAPTASATQPNAPVIITLHLAQLKPDADLIKVDAGGTPLYALPKPVLTQADMVRASPIETKDKRSFIMIEMNQAGIPKLRYVTEKARGNYLLLTIQGQLVSAAKIADTITDGKLYISTQSPQQTAAILRLMQGKR